MIKPLLSLFVIASLMTMCVLPAFAQERRTVTVRSQDYGYYYYRVNTGNRVSLTRQLSRTACEYNRTWGYDYRGVWVDRGCEAEFEVGGSGSNYPSSGSSSSSDGRREIYVSSPNYRYYKYNIQTDNEVELVRQLSNSPCDKNRTWGYDRNGVWVNQGCSGQFLVGKRPGGSNTGRNVAIGSAIAGGAVLAAILAARAKNNDKKDEVPDWLVGTFRGYNPMYNTTVDVTVYEGGSVSMRAGDQPTINGSYNDHQIELGNLKFKVSKERNGFRTTQVGREDNQVTYTRIY